MTLIIISGVVAGLLHVLSGPDHLAAVAPLAVDGGRRGWFAGWMWGVGHSTGVIAVAVLALLLREWIPPVEVLSQWSERAVGGALVAVGLWALRRSAVIESSGHTHGQLAHGHLHVQRGPRWLRSLSHAHASLCLGMLHGVAGSSHFFGVLPALALPSRAAGLTYITAFGVGTVGAMTIFAAVVGLAGARLLPNAVPHRALMLASSIAAVLVGGFWLLV